MWEGLRGAVCGVAQAAAAGKAGAGELREALALLRGPPSHTPARTPARPAADHIARTITKWAHQNRIPV